MADVRLIDANNLFQKIIDDDMIQCGTTFQHVCLAIKNATTIEAEPVKHGKWIDKTYWTYDYGAEIEYPLFECSVCGYTVCEKPLKRGDRKGGKYCDECGAKMGVDEKHD